MFIFACPIIAGSQSWLFSLRANIRICPQISAFAPNSTSGICVVNKISNMCIFCRNDHHKIISSVWFVFDFLQTLTAPQNDIEEFVVNI
jgi:hypothetical protein